MAGLTFPRFDYPCFPRRNQVETRRPWPGSEVVSALLPQPGGFEGRVEIPPPFVPDDLPATEGPGVSFLLHHLCLAPSAAGTEADPRDDYVTRIEELMQLVAVGVERLERF
jgi:hypothetical protein